jgi:hypothetical protein
MTLRTRLKRAERACPPWSAEAEEAGCRPLHIDWLVYLTDAELEGFEAAVGATLGVARRRRDAGEPPCPTKGWPNQAPPPPRAWPAMSTWAWLTDDEIRAALEAHRRFESLALARRDAKMGFERAVAHRAERGIDTGPEALARMEARRDATAEALASGRPCPPGDAVWGAPAASGALAMRDTTLPEHAAPTGEGGTA